MSDDAEPVYLDEPRKRPRWCAACCGVFGLLLLLCCLGLGWLQSRLGDPSLAEARMQALVPSSVPAGYAGNVSVELQGLLVAVLAPEGSPIAQGRFNIVAVAVPPQGDSALARGQLREGIVQQFQLQVEEAGEVEVTVRGETRAADQLRGVTPTGTSVRVVLLAIPRRAADDVDFGDVVLIAGGPEPDFDEQAWAAFLASIQ